MKKKLLNWVGILVCATIFLTSCLGDNESYFQSGSSLVLIKEDLYGKYAFDPTAIGQGAYLSYPKFNNYEVGTVLKISYKAYLDKYTTEGRFLIEEVSMSSDGQYALHEQPYMTEKVCDTVAVTDTLSAFLDWSYPVVSYAFNDFGDRWVFDCSYWKQETQSVDVNFFYDPENQKINGEALPKSECIVDVRLTKSPIIEGKKETRTTKRIVSNLSYLRGILEPMLEDPAQGGVFKIYFRTYVLKGANPTKAEPRIFATGKYIAFYKAE